MSRFPDCYHPISSPEALRFILPLGSQAAREMFAASAPNNNCRATTLYAKVRAANVHVQQQRCGKMILERRDGNKGLTMTRSNSNLNARHKDKQL